MNVNLAHDPYFWLGPVATIVTGLLALAGAIVAYRAVTRQIDANAKNVQKQIDAAAVQAQKDRDYEWARMRRGEVLDLLQETRYLARELALTASNYRIHTPSPGTPAGWDENDDPQERHQSEARFLELEVDVPILMDKLTMHELPDVSNALVVLNRAVEGVISNEDWGRWVVDDRRQAVFDAIKDALRKPAL